MADAPPPPPPPHGANPRPPGGLPDGNYDIFIIPPHTAGGGFLYLPSLQPHRNSFLAGIATALAAMAVYTLVAPVLKQWVSTIMIGGGGIGVLVLVLAIGVAGWALGKTQGEGTSKTGQPGGGTAGAAPPPKSSEYRAPPHESGGFNPGSQSHSSDYPPPPPHGHAPHHDYPPPPPHGRAPPPQPNGYPPPPPHGHAPPPHPNAYPPPPQPPQPPQPEPQPKSPPKPSAAASEWEKQREDLRKQREEQRKRAEDLRRTEELKKKREEAQKVREEAERAAKAKADKEKWEQVRQREKEQREREARERIARERVEREKEKREKEASEKAAKEKEAQDKETREREARERLEKARTAASARSSPSKPAGSRLDPESRYEKPTARSYAGTEDDHSFRPYDKRPGYKTSASSIVSGMSEGSYAPSQSTARTTPPPSHRGPYSTDDPTKIQIKAVYSFTDSFPLKPTSSLVAGVNNVTDGLVLRITSEGLFIDDEVRGIGQREWDIKAWTLKSVDEGHARAVNGPRSLHVLRASLKVVDNKRYIFIIEQSEAMKLGSGIERLRKGSQVRSFKTTTIKEDEVRKLLKQLGYI